MLRSTTRAALYYHRLYMAQPRWIDHDIISDMHREADRLRKEGYDVEIDHIVPLNNPYVSGLHWHGNMRIIYKTENQHKGNKYWPDMWQEQLTLF